ncbi:MAG: DUF5050 domain-containing protein, partial [Coriobacteriales bacterium]|nr:DUF5050 domain-containing protein [Coriobacteriales bacterium]
GAGGAGGAGDPADGDGGDGSNEPGNDPAGNPSDVVGGQGGQSGQVSPNGQGGAGKIAADDPLVAGNPLVQAGRTSLYDVDNDGNLADNITGEGIAVDQGDKVYVVDMRVKYDDYESIFELAWDGTPVRELYREVTIKFLNFYKDSLYFSTPKGLTRLDLKSGEAVLLKEGSFDGVYFDDGRLYLLSDRLVNVQLDGSEPVEVWDRGLSRTVNQPIISNGMLYYLDELDRNRPYRRNLATGETTLLADMNCFSLSLCNGQLYVVDKGDLNALKRVDLASGGVTTLSTDPYYGAVATTQGVFAKNGPVERRGFFLESLNGNGKNSSTVLSDIALEYYIAGEWIFYHNSADHFALWAVRFNGTEPHRVDFSQAALLV